MFASWSGSAESVGFSMSEQNCVIVNWNVRGLNMTTRRSVVKELIRDTRPTIISLHETKLACIDKDIVAETLGTEFMENFVFLPAQGARGGILLAVQEDHYSILSSDLGVHSVTATIKANSQNVEWSITAVYGPQGDNDKL